MKTIAFDMDGVLADLVTPWLAWINERFGDNLTYQNLNGYRIQDQSRGGKAVQEFLYLSHTYEHVQPIPGMLKVMASVRERGDRVIVATKASHNPNMIQGKMAWFRRHVPWLRDEDIMFIQDKSLVRADMLIDDDPRNLVTWHSAKVLVTHPYNIGYDTPPDWRRVSTSRDLEVLLCL
jgi:5'(3')-deoxyribonucleotidase